MGHSDWVNKRVHETGGMRWAGRDTMDETSSGRTHQQWSQLFAPRAAIPGNLSVVHFGLHPLTRFQGPHLTENTCHEKSDFYIIIMIIVYVL